MRLWTCFLTCLIVSSISSFAQYNDKLFKPGKVSLLPAEQNGGTPLYLAVLYSNGKILAISVPLIGNDTDSSRGFLILGGFTFPKASLTPEQIIEHAGADSRFSNSMHIGPDKYCRIDYKLDEIGESPLLPSFKVRLEKINLDITANYPEPPPFVARKFKPSTLKLAQDGILLYYGLLKYNGKNIISIDPRAQLPYGTSAPKFDFWFRKDKIPLTETANLIANFGFQVDQSRQLIGRTGLTPPIAYTKGLPAYLSISPEYIRLK